MSLANLLNTLEACDHEMNKEAEEMNKLAAEEEAAGRIMARGFMDELHKLAEVPSGPSSKVMDMAAQAKQKGMDRMPKPVNVYTPAKNPAPKGNVSIGTPKLTRG
jgi:hypothetical protein